MIRTRNNRLSQRCMSLLLSLALISTLLPAITPTAEAAHKYQEELDTLVEWGVMRGDDTGNLNPDGEITRAEFVAMINRAFGYNEVGATPFTDVYGYKWYADDIAIAYTAGYFKGTGDGTTASPDSNLTREQAAVLIARNLALEERSGEALGFTDSRNFSDFSRGMVESLIAAGIVYGYDDGSFKPLQNITRAEVACMLVRALGKPIQEAGDYALGGIYTNVTITTSGVTLRDTVIAGNLYLTGGISLGDVLLENVTVLGKIVACGGGESQSGENSIVLRNVTADEMVVDSIANQLVTISADGDTAITNTNVRTHAYIEDLTTTGTGLRYITLEGEEGTSLTLAGGINEVTNLTPSSTLSIAQGFAAEVTVDEESVNSVLKVENDAYIKQLNLDVGTSISGTGDIASTVINAAGSSSEILPDTITVRPGLTADIAGETMDTVLAAESSSDPRLLTGYPDVTDIAPTTAQALFSANKNGTIYWAVTAVADGSVDEEDLISPPSYSGTILQSGTIKATASNTEFKVKLSKLTSGGSYYLSAILVDSRGQRSPIKVTAFTTPDSSTPAFASGYPYMSKVTNTSAQVTVMTKKNCQLYYALLPKGASAPTAAEFKANAISGNLGYGSMTVTKNVPAVFYVNGRPLEELTSYDLYVWLTDFDGAKSSSVKKVSFTTIDGTSPIFLTEPTVTSIKATSVGLKAALNEKGTVYWAVVKHGEEYPKPLAGQTTQPTLDSDTAKLQIANGMNCLKSGKVSASATKDITINVSGLTAETAYDLYYVAVDSAGNYSTTVKMVTINTLDNVPPTITQTFSNTADLDGTEPMSDTDIAITFSEGIQYETGEILIDLYTTANTAADSTKRTEARERLEEILRSAFKLYDASSYPDTLVPEKISDSTSGHWICYEDLLIEMEDGKTVITFKNGKNINLKSGGTYYFQISNLYDTSNNKNRINPNPQDLPEFTTVFAQATLTNEGIANGPYMVNSEGVLTDEEARVDMSFQIHPISTENVDDTIYYDIFLWTDSYLEFDVYARVTNDITKDCVTDSDPMLTASTSTVDNNGWLYLGNAAIDGTDKPHGVSVHDLIDSNANFTKLNLLDSNCTYEYVISLTELNDLTDWQEWSGKVTFGVTIPAGKASSVDNLATSITEADWKEYSNMGLANGGIRAIGNPDDFSIFRQFLDTKAPSLREGYPTFVEGDTFVTMTLQSNRAGTVYYVMAPVTEVNGMYQYALTAYDTNNQVVTPDLVSEGGDDEASPALTIPTNRQIYSPSFNTSNIKTGRSAVSVANTEITVTDLLPMTTYYVYLVTKGDSANYSEVYLYQFTTQDAETPAITLTNRSPSVEFETSATSELHYALVAYKNIPAFLTRQFSTVADPATYTAEIISKYETDDNKALDGDSSTFSILDALLTTCTGNQQSVFDAYAKSSADSTIRETVAEYIREKDPDGGSATQARGSIPVIQEGSSNAKTINFAQYMTFGTQYYCLTVAHNVQGTTDGFKAIKNIHLPDATPPEYVSINTSVTSTTEKDGVKYYSGVVTISFSEPIYFISSDDADRVALPVWYHRSSDTPDPDGAIYFHNHVTSSFSYTCSTKESTTNSITLKFTDVQDGAYLIMFDGGFVSDSNSNSATRKDGASAMTLTLTFKAEARQDEIDPDYKGFTPELTQPAFLASWK